MLFFLFKSLSSWQLYLSFFLIFLLKGYVSIDMLLYELSLLSMFTYLQSLFKPPITTISNNKKQHVITPLEEEDEVEVGQRRIRESWQGETVKREKEKINAGCGVRTHAHLCAEDLKSSPLTSRANQLVVQ